MTETELSTYPGAMEEASATADAAFDLILLDPTLVSLFRTGGSSIRATISDPVLGAERTYLQVQIARAFPLSQPDRYIGLRDETDKDIGMISALKDLDAASRKVAEEELFRRYFVPVVKRVISVKEEFGTQTWEVETDRGQKTFIVQRIRDSYQTLSPTRIMLVDKDGTRFEFPNVEELDAHTSSFLQRIL